MGGGMEYLTTVDFHSSCTKIYIYIYGGILCVCGSVWVNVQDSDVIINNGANRQ